jgi:UDP-N-acetylglucosamine transferase subunit ALG13
MGNKIFITLGSQKFQFNRLLKAVDELCEKGTVDAEDVFAQIGYSDYLPKNYNYKKFLDRDEFSTEMSKAEIVITHGGTGAIIGAVKKGKKVIAVPRRVKYGEHVDDHQLQLIKQFNELELICTCSDCTKLDEAIKEVCVKTYKSYQSNTFKILDSIDQYIQHYQ